MCACWLPWSPNVQRVECRHRHQPLMCINNGEELLGVPHCPCWYSTWRIASPENQSIFLGRFGIYIATPQDTRGCWEASKRAIYLTPTKWLACLWRCVRSTMSWTLYLKSTRSHLIRHRARCHLEKHCAHFEGATPWILSTGVRSVCITYAQGTPGTCTVRAPNLGEVFRVRPNPRDTSRGVGSTSQRTIDARSDRISSNGDQMCTSRAQMDPSHS